MIREKKFKISIFLRYFARTVLLILGILLFIFSLLSGTERLGGGIIKIIYNSPNALPWLILLIFIFIAFKWEILGGLLILSMGVFTVFFFNTSDNLFVLWVISIPLILMGALLVIVWYICKH